MQTKMIRTAGLALAMVLGAGGAHAAERDNITIDDTRIFPESMTATAEGAVIIGSMKGRVYRAAPGETVARPWIEPTPENGLLAVFGVLADDRAGTLWLCSLPNPFASERVEGATTLMAFDLETGAHKATYPFPGGGVCNDIAVDEDGTAYATDTAGGRILKLEDGATALEIFGADAQLAGVDGIAFAEDGTMYINNVSTHELLRVGVTDKGDMGQLTVLETTRTLEGPDGFRPVAGNSFVLAEGQGGRLDYVVIEGDRATVTVLKDGLQSTPGATVVGDTAYVLDSKIQYLLDPALEGADPGVFEAIAVPLPDNVKKGQ